MFVELHLLQNFAPSNLNRDDTGSPKECEFGGYRRARISSQSLKRAIRKESPFAELLADRGGVRTRRLIVEVAERLSGERPSPAATVDMVSAVFKEGGIERPPARGTEDNERDFTKLILFMDSTAIDDMVQEFRQGWDRLTAGDAQTKQDTVRELGGILARAVRVPDIALFGRMIEVEANKPFGKLQLGVDAACQMAHALSTNRVSMEFDFFTAVDDLSPPADRGASMMGTVEFNSACFYRYANVDLDQLKKNLGGDEDLARRTVDAFLRASVAAVPTGKQNSMAAQNPPSFIMAVARQSGLWSLANAFMQPVRPEGTNDLMQQSVQALDRYWGQLVGLYGEQHITGVWCASLDGVGLDTLATYRAPTFDRLIQGVSGAIQFDGPRAGSA